MKMRINWKDLTKSFKENFIICGLYFIISLIYFTFFSLPWWLLSIVYVFLGIILDFTIYKKYKINE